MPANNNWDLEKNGPATVPEVVTPVDSADLTNPARALYIGASGNLKATFANGDIVTIMGLTAGQIYPFAVTKVFSGSTTASSIVALR